MMPKGNQFSIKLDDKSTIVLKGLAKYFGVLPTQLLREIAVRGLWKLYNLVRTEEGITLEEMLGIGGEEES